MAASLQSLAEKKRSRRVQTFGKDDCLIGSINDARVVDGQTSETGAILWGLGVAEVKTARRLAKRGIPSLQVRINNVDFRDKEGRNDTYDRHGIEFCVAAMDHLQAERGVKRFVLMGNCACASVCLNTAIVDPRVSGLILTNPHISKRQLLSVSLAHKVISSNAVGRLLRGDIDLSTNIIALAEVAKRRLSKRLPGRGGNAGAASNRRRPDFELPDDLVTELQNLAKRDVKTFLACAQTDDSMHYLRKNHGAGLDQLQIDGSLAFETVEVDTHVFSRDDKAAGLLNDAISRWVETTPFSGCQPASE